MLIEGREKVFHFTFSRHMFSSMRGILDDGPEVLLIVHMAPDLHISRWREFISGSDFFCRYLHNLPTKRGDNLPSFVNTCIEVLLKDLILLNKLIIKTEKTQ